MSAQTFFASALISLAIALPAMAGDITDVDIDTAEQLVKDEKVVVVDIRTPDEFAAGHIKGAKSVDFFSEDFEASLAKLDRSKPVLVHCKSGGRSTKALAIFKKLDFVKVYHMKDGFGAWLEGQKPVAK
jgi:rhodanese-related sulfurtransferase